MPNRHDGAALALVEGATRQHYRLSAQRGLLEYAQQIAAHESARATKLYDRRNHQLSLDQVERIVG
jgi:hypothetical protein